VEPHHPPVAGPDRPLSQIVGDYMDEHGLTLQAMAEQTGLSVASIAALRMGTRGKRPQPHTLAKLAAVMQRDVTELQLAVDGSLEGRRREQRLLRWFRSLDDDGQAQVERLIIALRASGTHDAQ
jgi:transcriptional regulator with XRE-family HTH domain